MWWQWTTLATGGARTSAIGKSKFKSKIQGSIVFIVLASYLMYGGVLDGSGALLAHIL